MTKLALALIAILAATACSGSGTVYSTGSVSAGVAYGAAPPLVEVQSGVWVVEAYDEPVFYSDDYYWLYRGGAWYRSPYHDHGWVTTYEVPYRVRSIDRPTTYVRYRGGAGTRYRQGPRGRVQVRDHRDHDRAVYGTRHDDDRRRQQQIRDEQIRQRQIQEQRQQQQQQAQQPQRRDRQQPGQGQGQGKNKKKKPEVKDDRSDDDGYQR